MGDPFEDFALCVQAIAACWCSIPNLDPSQLSNPGEDMDDRAIDGGDASS